MTRAVDVCGSRRCCQLAAAFAERVAAWRFRLKGDVKLTDRSDF